MMKEKYICKFWTEENTACAKWVERSKKQTIQGFICFPCKAQRNKNRGIERKLLTKKVVKKLKSK